MSTCRILGECKRELGLEVDVSSDEEALTNRIAAEGKDEPISEEEYHRMLRKHHRRRLLKRVRRRVEGRVREKGGDGERGRREGMEGALPPSLPSLLPRSPFHPLPSLLPRPPLPSPLPSIPSILPRPPSPPFSLEGEERGWRGGGGGGEGEERGGRERVGGSLQLR